MKTRYSQPSYDKKGKPKCELCGRHYNRVMVHVTQAHGMDAMTYKIRFNFNPNKAIISKKSKVKSSLAVQRNYGKVVANNLLSKGKEYRFKTPASEFVL